MRTAILGTLICFLTLAGCTGKHAAFRLLSEDEGRVYVYVQAFPQEAERLSFTVNGLSAVQEDGTAVPLRVRLGEVRPEGVRRQRFLAEGAVPAGRFRGLSIRVSEASLRTAEGKASLLVPEAAVPLDVPFEAKRARAVTLFLRFDYQKSVGGDFNFQPIFTPYEPGAPLTGLMGLVTNSASDSIALFDRKAFQVRSVLSAGRGPAGIVLDPVQLRAYVALSEEDQVTVIDLLTGDRLNDIRLNPGDRPMDLAITPDRGTILCVNRGSNSVSFLDPQSFLETGRTQVGDDPRTVLLDRGGKKRAYVFNSLSNSISVVDISTMTTAVTIPTEIGPFQGQFDRKGDKLYVIYEGSPYLTVMDIPSFQVSKRIFIGRGAASLKVDTATDMIYIARKNSNEIEIYDPFTFIVQDRITSTGGAGYMTIDGEENDLLLLSPDERTLTFVNVNSRKVLSVLDVGDDPYRVAVMGER